VSFTLVCQDLNQIPYVANKILKKISPYKIILFYGGMGIGKTTLIKELSLQLGFTKVVSSPTFSFVNEYIISENKKIYHFDFFRLRDEKEAFEFGLDEYFLDKNCYIFIEWPEKIHSFVEDNMVVVKMKLADNNRVIEIIF
jgi:tRNA threonylcarbamoyladenosine biosynthesis protein TsaE